MVVKDTSLRFNKSGGSSNEDQDLSLGGTGSTATNRYFVDNFLHNFYDETEKSEALQGDIEYRHFYFVNGKTYQLKNCKLVILSNTKEKWSKVQFAKGTAANGFVEQAVANENTAPVGISESAWISSGSIALGTINPGSTASIWSRRMVLPASLIVNNEKVVIRIMGDPPPSNPNVPPPETPSCNTGYHWDPTTQQCVQDTVVSCPAGQHLDTTTQTCVPDDEGPVSTVAIKVAICADGDCSSESNDVYAFIAALEPDLFIKPGDITYSSNVDCFADEMTALGIHDKTKIAIGNHDSDEDGSDSMGQDALSEFGHPSSGYYSFNFQNVHFLCMNTQADYDAGSAQHTFVNNDLSTAAASSTIDWIIVYYHKPTYTAPSNHGGLTDFRDIYHPIFDQYHVDLICSGHNHNMQRTYPIRYNASSPGSPTVASTAPNNIYTNVDGRIFCIAGAGGRSNYSIDSTPSYMPFTNDSDNGILWLEWVENERAVICNFVLAQSGSTVDILDAWRIEKSSS